MTSPILSSLEGVQAEMIPPRPTPHWGSQSGVAFTVHALTTISSHPQPALDALLETSTWPKWNNFVPRAFIENPSSDSPNSSRLQPGTMFTEDVDMAGHGRSTMVKTKLLMTSLDEMDEPGKKGFKVVWLGRGFPDWALRTERVHELYEGVKAGETVYECYETFSGPLAWIIKFFLGGTLVKRFGQWNGELRGFVEGLK